MVKKVLTFHWKITIHGLGRSITLSQGHIGFWVQTSNMGLNAQSNMIRAESAHIVVVIEYFIIDF